MAVKIRIEPHRRSFRVDNSKGFRPLFWSGTDVVGIQKNASAYFFERSKSSCVALTPPAGGGGKTYVVKGVAICNTMPYLCIEKKQLSYSQIIFFVLFFVEKKVPTKSHWKTITAVFQSSYVGLLCYCDFDFSSLLVEIVGFHVRQD
jgi:hypothetical protein